jgi:predicted small secreted protein
MKKIALMLIALALLAGCNTINGVGKDLERLGGKVRDASSR